MLPNNFKDSKPVWLKHFLNEPAPQISTLPRFVSLSLVKVEIKDFQIATWRHVAQGHVTLKVGASHLSQHLP